MSLSLLVLVLGMACCSFRLVVSASGYSALLAVKSGNLQTYAGSDLPSGGTPLADLLSNEFDLRKPAIGGAPTWELSNTDVEKFGISIPVWLMAAVLTAWMVLIEIYGDPYGVRRRAKIEG
jgi:hypothetical protein